MANHFRILTDVWSSTRAPLDSFVGWLVTEGFYAHYPVADRDPVLDENGDRSICPDIAAWGAYLFPDMRMMTPADIVDSDGNEIPDQPLTSTPDGGGLES